MSTEIPDRARLSAAIDWIGAGLIERAPHARAMLLATLCGEHLLLVGPPGTAKSELARRLHQLFGGRYFERLLTRFTVPEELFGPLSLAALDEGRYERDLEGYLPSASIGFLDEVFKANSAILNALLTLLNERLFDQGPNRIPVPLVSMLAASNEIPDDDALSAFHDRFLFRLRVAPVSDEGFEAMLLAEAPTASPLQLSLAELDAVSLRAARVVVATALLSALRHLRRVLADQDIVVSDRRWVRALRVLKISAASNQRAQVVLADFAVLPWLLSDRPQAEILVEQWFCEQLGSASVLDPVWLMRVVQAFEQQIELEESATELAFDDSGKLSLIRRLGGVDEQSTAQAAPRLSAFSQRRRYSATHIGARIAQIDAYLGELDQLLDEARAHRSGHLSELDSNIWVAPALLEKVNSTFEQTLLKLTEQRACLVAIRARYSALPLSDLDDGLKPQPIEIHAG